MHLTMLATIFLASFAGLAVFLRGGRLHNHLVLETEKIFRSAGIDTLQEHPYKLWDGRLVFVVLMVLKQFPYL